ncbi:MAG: alpha/beta fold hydrolase [Chloroflexi bacterium]|nr:alpha/beta fold hydrolase [Chloroflexota bacterium]
MATYLIVHGGFSGGWGWRTVANLLRKADHEVFTPTLTGLGERAHLATPEINLHTHIQDIVGVLVCEDLWNVVLVGHSSSAMVITGVAEKAAERISRLVYVDTAVPQNGQSWFDILGPEITQTMLAVAEKKGGGWRIPLLSNPPRHQPQPLKTVTDKLEINNPAAARIPRAYIHCSEKSENSPVAPAWPAINKAAEHAKQQGWWYRTLPTGHSPHHTMPHELTTLLLEFA